MIMPGPEKYSDLLLSQYNCKIFNNYNHFQLNLHYKTWMDENSGIWIKYPAQLTNILFNNIPICLSKLLSPRRRKDYFPIIPCIGLKHINLVQINKQIKKRRNKEIKVK